MLLFFSVTIKYPTSDFDTFLAHDLFTIFSVLIYDISLSHSKCTTGKNMEYLESTMETLVFDILVYWKLLGIKQKQDLWLKFNVLIPNFHFTPRVSIMIL